jgi:hypothetical protein
MDEFQSSLFEIVSSALNKVYEQDRQMIFDGASEMSIVFRLGLYIAEQIEQQNSEHFDDGITVDCEYNRNQGEPKRINYENNDAGIRPDLLIHRRGDHTANYLVLEAKGYWNREDREGDFRKLRALTDENGGYAYQLGLHVELGRKVPTPIIFVNGNEVQIDE